MAHTDVIEWLLQGDVSIQYQTYRDLLDTSKVALQKRISKEGWGKKFLSCRNKTGHWGRGFYQPKWISSHYTLLDLKNLAIAPNVPEIKKTLDLIFADEMSSEGGLYPIGLDQKCDVCINGMALNYSSYFRTDSKNLKPIVDFILSQHMKDGGFNCRSNSREGAVHSSLHTTLSVLEGILEYQRNGYTHGIKELQRAARESIEFILVHRLFRSHRTGEIIDDKMLRFSWPCRWRYDIFRALDYFREASVKYDNRMDEALEILQKKMTSDKKWLLPAKYPGQTHFEMEAAGKPSWCNTLRAMRILNYFKMS